MIRVLIPLFRSFIFTIGYMCLYGMVYTPVLIPLFRSFIFTEVLTHEYMDEDEYKF